MSKVSNTIGATSGSGTAINHLDTNLLGECHTDSESAAIVASRHFPVDGGSHLNSRSRLALGSQTAGYRVKIGLRKPGRGIKQNAVAVLFDGRSPARLGLTVRRSHSIAPFALVP
jgi:hypothetical protein